MRNINLKDLVENREETAVASYKSSLEICAKCNCLKLLLNRDILLTVIFTPFFLEYAALLDGKFPNNKIPDSLDEIILLIDLCVFLRLIFLVNIVKYSSLLNTYKGRITCVLSNLKPTDKLMFRAWLHYNPG